jgi:glutamine cyclotransferase
LKSGAGKTPDPLFWNVKPTTAILLLGAALSLLAGCGRGTASATPNPLRTNESLARPAPASGQPVETNAQLAEIPMYSCQVIHIWPHDRNAFTQGLVFLDGKLLESTGLYGQSTLRQVELETGKVLRQIPVPNQYFAEGMAVLGGKIFQLTWRHGKGFVYDLETWRREKEFAYAGEGWGLATDGQSLILSDGTEQLRFLDPVTFQVKRTVRVHDHGRPLTKLNELEYVKGEIFANIWTETLVARIDPATGRLLGLIDFSGLLALEDYRERIDVLNGIAYDAKGDRLFVTGKWWPKLFEVRLKAK